MAIQQAIVLTNWKGTGTANDPFRPALADLLQAGETCVNLEARANLDISALADDACVVLVEGDETRISLMDGTTHKVIWKRYIAEGSSAVSGFNPDTPFSAAQVSALNTWMQNKFGVNGTQIAAWFGVTGAQLSAWLQAHTKQEAVDKLIVAWRQKVWK